MATTPYLRPTTIQRVRGFLEQAAVPIPAWASRDAVLDALWTTLRRRREDAALWARLALLLADLERDVAAREGGDRLAHPAADPLAGERAAALVAELREALGAPDDPSAGGGVARRGMAGLGAPLVACLLLLAGACRREHVPVSTAVDTTPPVPAAAEVQAPGPSAAEAALEERLAGAPLPDETKATLSSCFAGLDPSRRTDLEALFRDKSAVEIAAALEALLQPGAACHVEASGPVPGSDAGFGPEPPEDAGTPPGDAGPAPTDDAGGSRPSPYDRMVPIYKGVAL